MIQLSYLSAARDPMSAEDLLALLEQCLANNPRRGITGLLLYGNGTFLQALEGEETVIDTLYEAIERDPRHKSIKFLYRKAIERRQYPDWGMGFRRMSEAHWENIEGLETFKKGDFNPEFLAEHSGLREELMSHYAQWDPLLREVDKNERHVKHLQEALRRTEGGIEIARLVLEGLVESGAAKALDDRHERLCTFALDHLRAV